MPADLPITLRAETPDQADVRELLGQLDAYLMGLYEPGHNHILDVQALLAPQVFFIVARRAGVAVGCGAVRVMPVEQATGGLGYGEIKRMFVRPEMRGQRLGERLLDELEAHLRRRGIALAMLETGDRQPEALRLYERSGYAPCAPFGGYEDNGTSVFYAKPLS